MYVYIYIYIYIYIIRKIPSSSIPPGKHTCCLCVRTLLLLRWNNIDATPLSLHRGMRTLALRSEAWKTCLGMRWRYLWMITMSY